MEGQGRLPVSPSPSPFPLNFRLWIWDFNQTLQTAHLAFSMSNDEA